MPSTVASRRAPTIATAAMRSMSSRSVLLQHTAYCSSTHPAAAHLVHLPTHGAPTPHPNLPNPAPAPTFTDPISIQVKLKFGKGPKISVLQLIGANEWMVPQLLPLHAILEEHGLVDSAARGSVTAQSNHEVVRQFRERCAPMYPNGTDDLRLSSPHLLHAGLEALLAQAGTHGKQWLGPPSSRHPTPTSLPDGITPADLFYEFAMLLGCYVCPHIVKPRARLAPRAPP